MSGNVLRVAAMFGLGLDEDRQSITLIPPTSLQLQGGQILFITGPSGSGKSTLLRLIAQAISDRPRSHTKLIRFDALPALPDRPLVDCFDMTLDATLGLLARAGLGDAFVMLRRPCELSDGQRYRLRLAQAMALAEQYVREAADAPDPTNSPATVILADEFGATLDRITAAVLARNVRKWMRNQSAACFIAATTHDDLLEPLDPDWLIEKPLGEAIHVHPARRATCPA